MISHIVAFILISSVPEWRMRLVTFCSTGNCDTGDSKLIQDLEKKKKKESDVGHEAFESLSHWRLHTSVPPLFLFSIHLFTFKKASVIWPHDRLGPMMRTSLGIRTGSVLEPALYGLCGQLCHSSSSPCCFSSFLLWYCLERTRYTLLQHLQ